MKISVAKLFILFAIFLSRTDQLKADATPFKLTERIHLSYQTSKKLNFDSCGIVYWNIEQSKYDTFFNCKGFHCVSSENANFIKLSRGVPDSFRVLLIYKERTMLSPLLKESGINSYHRLLVTDTEVKNITPVFGVKYAKYILALSITIVLEVLVYLLIFIKEKPFVKLKYIVVMNLITHPILWLVCTQLTGFFNGSIYGEPIVILVEALFLKGFAFKQKPFLRLLFVSILLNLVSFVFGGTLYFIISSLMME